MFIIFLQAGLKSAIIHSKFRKEAGGPLQLVRRCEAYTCEGHCTCAAQDKMCPISSPVACVNDTASRNIVFEFNCIYIPHKWNRHDLLNMFYFSSGDSHSRLMVTDHIGFPSSDVNYTPSDSVLQASWRITQIQNYQPVW